MRHVVAGAAAAALCGMPASSHKARRPRACMGHTTQRSMAQRMAQYSAAQRTQHLLRLLDAADEGAAHGQALCTRAVWGGAGIRWHHRTVHKRWQQHAVAAPRLVSLTAAAVRRSSPQAAGMLHKQLIATKKQASIIATH